MSLFLKVQTFFRSCPDALHYYGVIQERVSHKSPRFELGAKEYMRTVHEIKRKNSRESVIGDARLWAWKRKRRLTVIPETENL